MLAVEDGVLLRSLAELARSSRIEDKDQNPVNNAASNDHDDTPGQFALRLTSFEVRRCGVKGLALCDFLASPACEELQHLFIGGCKRVRASHLEVAPTSFARGDRSKSDYGKKQPLGANLDPAPGKALPTGSTRPLELELDGRLLSTALLKRLGLRIVHLRIFEPAAVHLDLLIKALEKRRLPNLSELVVLPAEIDLDGWSEPSADTDLEETSPCGTPLEAVHSLDSDSTASSLCMPGNEESVKEPSALEDKAPTIGPECQDPRASRGRRNSVIGVQPSPQKGELRSRVLSALSCYECSTERGASEHERRRPSLKVGDNLWTSVRQRRMEMGWWNKIEAAAEAAKKAASDSEPGALQVLGGPWGLGELGNSGLGMWGTPVVENVLHAL